MVPPMVTLDDGRDVSTGPIKCDLRYGHRSTAATYPLADLCLLRERRIEVSLGPRNRVLGGMV